MGFTTLLAKWEVSWIRKVDWCFLIGNFCYNHTIIYSLQVWKTKASNRLSFFLGYCLWIHNNVRVCTYLIDYKLALASVRGHFWLVCAHEKFSFEQLHSNNGEHEYQQQGDQDNVVDSFDSYNDTLHNVFQTFSSIDGT